MKKLFDVSLRTTVLAAALALVSACGDDTAPPQPPATRPTATAALEARSSSTTTGTATFTEENGKVTLKLDVAGATPGQHGAHIHQVGDCGADDASSAGGHWNPEGHNHGAPTAEDSHLGDLGNITVGQDGRGSLTISMADWKLGDGSTTDVVGKAVVIHASPDDLTSQPAGNSGARVACGVIQKK
jgi:Cu-Zn family superoxide dismutase